MPRPRRSLLRLAVSHRIRSVSGAVRHSELVHVNVRREQVVLGSDLLQARCRRPAGERIRRRQVHHVVRQPETDLRVGPPVVRPAITAGAREQRRHGRGNAGGCRGRGRRRRRR